MTSRRWKTLGAWTLAALLSLAGLLWLAECLDRGVVMRPVRKIAEKLDIDIPRPTITPTEDAEARAMAKEWKQECLDKFPELRVAARPVPEAENGFCMLYRLDKQPPVSKELADVLREMGNRYQGDVAPRLFDEHQVFVEHIESIADLPERSSMNLSPCYQGFINAAPTKQAVDILLLKACLAAEARNEEQALLGIRRAGNLIAHLRDIETPSLFGETVTVLAELALQRIVMRDILSKLGPKSDLAAWKELTTRTGHGSPHRFAQVLRGEWHTGADADLLAFHHIATEDKLGLLEDGRGCAVAYSAWMVRLIGDCESATKWHEVDVLDHQNAIAKLPAEQANLMSLLTSGLWSWRDGFAEASLTNARYQAALELLILEKNQPPLTADSAREVTQDPFSGGPFIFDPVKRTLEVPPSSNKHGWVPLKLPW